MKEMVAPKDPVLSSSILPRMPKLPFVRFSRFHILTFTYTVLAKFTGYQYGGRPLGLSYVRYTNREDGGDLMDADNGLTQDQMM